VRPGQAVLEVGCGEGGNLVNLLAAGAARPRMIVGVDLFERKLSFARAEGVAGHFVCGDALALPFRDRVFDAILCRDVLHHVEQPERVMAELRRVCKAGGTAWVIEPNGRNPLIWGLARLRPHERGQLRNSVASITALGTRWFPHVEVEVRQPLPIYRLALHYQFGFPRLGSFRPCQATLDALDRAFRVLWPLRAWAYIVARLRTSAD